MGASLLVLAAGMGSRFGGLKQMAGVGPNGEVLLEYSVHDALRNGFDEFVFVIRHDIEADFREHVLSRFPEDLNYKLVYQELHDVPEGFSVSAERIKPWGTAHAVWCAREAISQPFAVINADDFYGADAFRALGEYLNGERKEGEWCMVGYELGRTLSEAGHVSRGVCTSDAEGLLQGIEEHTKIVRQGDGIVDLDSGRSLAEDTVVSMNCWGFTPDFLTSLDSFVQSFFRDGDPGLKGESYIPSAVYSGISQGVGACRVLASSAQWCGVTYPDDRPVVEQALAVMVRDGQYGSSLW